MRSKFCCWIKGKVRLCAFWISEWWTKDCIPVFWGKIWWPIDSQQKRQYLRISTPFSFHECGRSSGSFIDTLCPHLEDQIRTSVSIMPSLTLGKYLGVSVNCTSVVWGPFQLLWRGCCDLKGLAVLGCGRHLNKWAVTSRWVSIIYLESLFSKITLVVFRPFISCGNKTNQDETLERLNSWAKMNARLTVRFIEYSLLDLFIWPRGIL